MVQFKVSALLFSMTAGVAVARSARPFGAPHQIRDVIDIPVARVEQPFVKSGVFTRRQTEGLSGLESEAEGTAREIPYVDGVADELRGVQALAPSVPGALPRRTIPVVGSTTPYGAEKTVDGAAAQYVPELKSAVSWAVAEVKVHADAIVKVVGQIKEVKDAEVLAGDIKGHIEAVVKVLFALKGKITFFVEGGVKFAIGEVEAEFTALVKILVSIVVSIVGCVHVDVILSIIGGVVADFEGAVCAVFKLFIAHVEGFLGLCIHIVGEFGLHIGAFERLGLGGVGKLVLGL